MPLIDEVLKHQNSQNSKQKVMGLSPDTVTLIFAKKVHLCFKSQNCHVLEKKTVSFFLTPCSQVKQSSINENGIKPNQQLGAPQI